MEEILLETGTIGIIVIVLARVVVLLYKKLDARSEEQDKRQMKTETELEHLRDRLDKYMAEDRVEMLQVIRENTEAFKKLAE